MRALRVRHEPASAAIVRRNLESELSQLGVVPDAIDLVLLVTTELVGNAVRHSAPDDQASLDVEWDLTGDRVMVRVADASPALPRRQYPRPDQSEGRGLGIVTAVAESWGADTSASGKRVWARVPVQRLERRSQSA